MLGNANRTLEPQLTARFNDETNITFYKNLIEEYRADGRIRGPVDYIIEPTSDFEPPSCSRKLAIVFDNTDDLAFFIGQRGKDRHFAGDTSDAYYNIVFHQVANLPETFAWNDYVRGMTEAENLGNKDLLNKQQDLLTAVLIHPKDSPAYNQALEVYDAFRVEVGQAHRQSRALATTAPRPVA
jgi:hypothetical protein